MSDNIAVTPGAGATVATDECTINAATVQVPRGKVGYGGDGVYTEVSAANPLPTQIRNSGGTEIGTNANPVQVGDGGASLTVDDGGGSVTVDGTVDTELPAAAALADAATNPTAPLIGGCLLVFNGASWDRLRAANVFKDLSALSITAIATAWTPASGKKFRLLGGCVSVSAACSVLFEDNAAGGGNYICRTPKLLADTPYNFVVGNGNGFLSPTADHVLKMTASAAAAVTGFLFGCEES